MVLSYKIVNSLRFYWNNWIPQFFDYDFFFSKNPNWQFFDFGIFRKRLLSPVVLELNSHSSYEESVALDLDLMSQRNPSPNLAMVSSSFWPYFGNAPTLGLMLHESYFISKSWMVHKSFAQMKSNDNLMGQRLSA